MPIFKKKPDQVEAWQVNLAEKDKEPAWIRAAMNSGQIYYQGGDEPYMTVEISGNGRQRAYPGDYIVKDFQHCIFVAKKDRFEHQYQPA